jgi:hypothetical protein
MWGKTPVETVFNRVEALKRAAFRAVARVA